MAEQKTDQAAVSVSIGRQPVFDEKGRLWGYELFCIGSAGETGRNISEQPDIAISLASSAYISLQQILKGGKKIIVDFTEKSILDKLPYALPPVLAAIKVDEQSCRRQSSMDALERLKADGYLVAVRNYSGNPDCELLYRLADILAIDTYGKGKEELKANLAAARKHNALLFASGVQDRNLHEICRDLGFSLFSGPYFKSPDKITVRKLASNEIVRLQLLELIENEDISVPKLAGVIQSDATISYRLLAFLNSAAFAFSQKIKSIHQAISLLGWSKVKNWLRVVVLTDINQNKEAEELVLISAQRGMFLELVARDHDYWGFDPESLHLLGVFSLLDALLGIPMAEIVTHLPIDNKMKAALCHEPNNEYMPLLHFVQCFEEARWADADMMIQQLGLDAGKVRAAFQKSLDWAGELESLRAEKPGSSL